VGADSAETRARILRAAREVITERGYEAANFQAIASRAGLSRPTMHYYFHTREDIHECLVAEAYSIVADCIAQAKTRGYPPETAVDIRDGYTSIGVRGAVDVAVHHCRPAGIPPESEPA